MNKIVKLIITSIFASIVLASGLIYFINKKQSIELPIKEEQYILNRFSAEITKISLSSHPSDNYISWDREEKHSGEISLKISVKDTNGSSEYYSNINLRTPLDLSSHKDRGFLEFWIKGGKNYSCIKSLEFYLQDKRNTQIKAPTLQFVKLNDKWNYVSIPLSIFLKEKGSRWNGREWLSDFFDWNGISSLVFSISSSKDRSDIEIFIDDFKIINKNEVIYNLFFHFE